TGPSQQGCRWRRRRDPAGGGSLRGGTDAGGAARALAEWALPPTAGAQGLHPQAGKAEGAPPTRNPAGAGPGGADRGQADLGADLRGQLPALLVRIPTEADGTPGAGVHPQGHERRGAVGGGGGLRRLLRVPGPGPVVGSGGLAGEGPQGTAVDAVVDEGGVGG